MIMLIKMVGCLHLHYIHIGILRIPSVPLLDSFIGPPKRVPELSHSRSPTSFRLGKGGISYMRISTIGTSSFTSIRSLKGPEVPRGRMELRSGFLRLPLTVYFL